LAANVKSDRNVFIRREGLVEFVLPAEVVGAVEEIGAPFVIIAQPPDCFKEAGSFCKRINASRRGELCSPADSMICPIVAGEHSSPLPHGSMRLPC
jgi:hypothetical protein